MKLVQELEGSAGFRVELAGGVKPSTEELEVFRDGVFTAAVVDSNVMYTIVVENAKA